MSIQWLSKTENPVFFLILFHRVLEQVELELNHFELFFLFLNSKKTIFIVKFNLIKNSKGWLKGWLNLKLN